MKYDDLLKAGRAMDERERHDTLASLCGDPRFAAWVGMMDQARMDFSRAGCAQEMAQSHGHLAHCAGSVYALDQLEGLIRHVADRPQNHTEH